VSAPNEQPGTDNRSRILAGALQLFATHGYDAVGVRDICATAGVTRPTLYHYFGSKRGVLETMVQERGTPLLTQATHAANYTGDLPRTLHRVVTTYFQFATHEPVLYRLLLALWFAMPEHDAFQVVATFNEHQQQQLETLFAQATHDHGNMRGRQRIYAATLLGMIHTYVGLALNSYLELTDERAHQVVQQFSHGIYS
jgi:TetR/AcrR family transcriptional regulator